ncbi:MAG TPA: GatB/YqeY domain-containing protein [Candidatus Hydrogenedentes bacterium]|mgnify:FL=1|nr:GatB/YqeY domain-containing protein [Candidatus Hydrogenedentota bacterium]HOV74088.1 GatB/YqeY domain-containing protein [Candidatus Hydrogenedentota bacterium]HPC15926.1 GatB/YqeY domain-containing protein [Candidatus Hydrogenedentota bacterium]HRT19880.1 GatB/YqeY domain-containing protein [Candidatus Hydrogenedentota bacterium]HRT65460.1 GatB/YqeY domain-containing protein [Candidatus Hydrogenedentota bacterium]
MSIKERVQEEITKALKARDTIRLECLRLAKGAILLKEKESAAELTDEMSGAALRAEIKKRQQSIEIFRQHGKEAEAAAAENEIRIIEEFLPKQMSADEIEAKVRAYLAEHPELNHPGKLTGALKKELGDRADGKVLNEICRKALGV